MATEVITPHVKGERREKERGCSMKRIAERKQNINQCLLNAKSQN